MCSLDWLNHFIDFFREDFLSALDRARTLQIESGSDMSGQHLKIEEEVKEEVSVSQQHRPFLTIETGNGNTYQNHFSNPEDHLNDLRKNKNNYLDGTTNKLLRAMYTKQFPDIISTILRLKHSKKINDIDCKRLVENINGRFLRTVIQILSERDEFEHIFHRLKKEYE